VSDIWEIEEKKSRLEQCSMAGESVYSVATGTKECKYCTAGMGAPGRIRKGMMPLVPRALNSTSRNFHQDRERIKMD
jgi:hypothetical protein